MTDWPAPWRPVNAEEARKYLDAHKDGSGDPELMEECEQLISLDESPPARLTRDVPPTDPTRPPR